MLTWEQTGGSGGLTVTLCVARPVNRARLAQQRGADEPLLIKARAPVSLLYLMSGNNATPGSVAFTSDVRVCTALCVFVQLRRKQRETAN